MAASIVKIQITENGSLREITVYSPEINIHWVDHETDSLSVTLGILGLTPLEIAFPNSTVLATFLADLDTALTDGTDTATLANAGEVLMITTTTSTTSTTTLP